MLPLHLKRVIKQEMNKLDIDLFCKIYIYCDLAYDELLACILKYVNGKNYMFHEISSDWCEAYLIKNKEFSYEYFINHKDDFVYWNYILDIEPNEDNGISENEYIIKVKDLVNILGDICRGVVPSCDFEDLLH